MRLLAENGASENQLAAVSGHKSLAEVQRYTKAADQAGLAKAGRTRAQYEISGGGFLATGPDDAAVAERFEWVRQRVAFYGSTPAYYPVLAVHGLEDLGLKLNAMVRQGKWSEMAKEVPDDVAHLFGIFEPSMHVARYAPLDGAAPWQSNEVGGDDGLVAEAIA